MNTQEFLWHPKKFGCWTGRLFCLLVAYALISSGSFQTGKLGLSGFFLFGLPQAQAQNCDINAFEDESHIFEASTTDPDGDDLNYVFHWGDGTSARAPLSGYVSSGTSQQSSHSWALSADYPSTYVVTSVASDVSGAQSGDSNAYDMCVTVKGDLKNLNQRADSGDVTCMTNMLLAIWTLDDDGTVDEDEYDQDTLDRSDLNRNGRLDSGDKTLLRNILLGIET